MYKVKNNKAYIKVSRIIRKLVITNLGLLIKLKIIKTSSIYIVNSELPGEDAFQRVINRIVAEHRQRRAFMKGMSVEQFNAKVSAGKIKYKGISLNELTQELENRYYNQQG